MKKYLTILLAFLLLCMVCGCTEQAADTGNYSNANLYCSVNDLLFLNDWDRVMHGALDTDYSLCRDPLCTHDKFDETCPESTWFFANNWYQTDGERVFMDVYDQRPGIEYHSKTGQQAPMMRTIYSFDPTEPDNMTKLVEYETTGALAGLPFCAAGEYVYYKQNRYLDPDRETDEVFRIMRVKKTRSAPEEVLDRDFPVSTVFVTDGERFFLTDTNAQVPVCEIYNSVSGESTVISPDGKGVVQTVLYAGDVYILAKGTTRTTREGTPFTSSDVYRYEDDGSCTLLAENTWGVRFFDGFLWYTPADLIYYGTVMAFNGIEEAPLDIYAKTTGELVRLDPVSGESMTWKADADIEFYGYSAGYAIAQLTDYPAYAETGERDRSFYKLELHDDGTVTVKGEITP
ncbi:MAG: hypothetical protein IJC71_03250 [Clostridia bacterium]|nr:hypothetical protein [Clostridia bacterium]